METETVAVRLPIELGVKACGPYKAGVVYQVEAIEAGRLINVKRFERVDAPDDEQET